ncbi:MAG: universal stress protein [Vicinamibacteria bacterium]
MFKRILCGLDFSPASVKAFETAAEVAAAMNAELHLVHVIEAYPVTVEWLPVRGIDDITLSMEMKAKEAMDALVERNASALGNVRLTTEITTGRAYVEISNRARDREFDLVVLGSKGIKLLDESFVGSTTERVMKSTEGSVLVVKR